MGDVTGLLAAASLLLVAAVAGREALQPDAGFCTGSRCFTVHRKSANFHEAQLQCAIMTVRSAESHDILAKLVDADSADRYWIGLQLESDCPDPAVELRGFQWVTGDTQSDISNWASAGVDDSCSSPRCVSVSSESDFAWTPQPCDERAAGFFCENHIDSPCLALHTSAEQDAYTYLTPLGFGGEDLPLLPPGTTATRVSTEEKHLCANEKWLAAPWPCEILEGGCEYKCATDPNQQPACYCPPGQTVHPTNEVTCEVGLDDPCLALRCAHACYATGGAHACTCDHGYKLAADGRSCVDFDECYDGRQCPEENTVCVNKEGGFACQCRPGFKAEGERCVDVDECVSGPCEHMCVNTAGGYECECVHGFIRDPREPHKCKQHCGDEECVAVCDPNNALQCTCPDGYIAEVRGDTTYCLDYDECESNFCDMLCVNTFGGYVCSCEKGFELVDEYSCVRREFTDPPVATSPASLPRPEPTRRPSGVSVGAFVGIILCTVFFIVLLVFLAHHALSRRGKIDSAGAIAAPADEAHGLRQVAREP